MLKGNVNSRHGYWYKWVNNKNTKVFKVRFRTTMEQVNL